MVLKIVNCISHCLLPQSSMEKQPRIALKSTRVAVPSGIEKAIVCVSDGKIRAVLPYHAEPDGYVVEDIGDQVLFPGLVDMHVHINEPGRTHWEGFDTATRAAAAGGITTLIEMPLNASPVTTSANSLFVKLNSARGRIHVNCGFWGGLVPDNGSELEELLDQGAFGLKAFLTHSGIDEFPNVKATQLRLASRILKTKGKPLLVHCEIDSFHNDTIRFRQNPRSYAAYVASRPDRWEVEAIEMVLKVCSEIGARTHIVHLATAQALPLIRKAKADGLPVTVETCPHYLVFESESIPDGETMYKCAPPIRDKATQDALWEALREGTLDFIASDHSPAPPESKSIETGNLSEAWGGIAGLQFSLPAIWTNAFRRGFSLHDVACWLSSKPAAFCGLGNQKGKIAEGFDADLMVWDPEKLIFPTKETVWHRHKISPYLYKSWQGEVLRTYVSGQMVYDSGRFLHLNRGEILLSPSTSNL
jgi:allantoinase